MQKDLLSCPSIRWRHTSQSEPPQEYRTLLIGFSDGHLDVPQGNVRYSLGAFGDGVWWAFTGGPLEMETMALSQPPTVWTEVTHFGEVESGAVQEHTAEAGDWTNDLMDGSVVVGEEEEAHPIEVVANALLAIVECSTPVEVFYSFLLEYRTSGNVKQSLSRALNDWDLPVGLSVNLGK